MGDPAQLPPVGSGAVWHRLQDLDVRDRFGPAAVHLEHVYRNRGALAQLATRLREDGLDGFALALEQLPPTANVLHRRERLQRLPLALRRRWPSRLERLAQLASGLETIDEADLEEASRLLFKELEHDLVLCPRRRGRWSLRMFIALCWDLPVCRIPGLAGWSAGDLRQQSNGTRAGQWRSRRQARCWRGLLSAVPCAGS